MPIVKHSRLPSFDRLEKEGVQVMPEGRALHQDIRELHIGFLNMMPDAALEATERQFFRLIGESSRVAQLYIHPFSLAELERGEKARQHIEKYYDDFENLKSEGLDALIITGANITTPDLEKEPFFKPLGRVVEWALDNVASTLCSCVSTHAVVQLLYGQRRKAFASGKVSGIFRHKVVDASHPMVRSMNSVFDAPHSRRNGIDVSQFRQAGMRILVESPDVGVHLATSADGFRLVCMQGHPEYDTISLLKEYRRDLLLFYSGDMDSMPSVPVNYLGKEGEEMLANYLKGGEKKAGEDFPEKELGELIENTWRDSARSMISSWIGLVYQVTNVDRKKQYMDGVLPEDPLGMFN